MKSLFKILLISSMCFVPVLGNVGLALAEDETKTIEIIEDKENIADGSAILQIQTSSNNPDIIEIEGIRELSNAKYSIFNDASCNNEIASLVTNTEGWTEPYTLQPGTYYVKQVEASKRHSLDENVYEVVLGNQTKGIVYSKTDSDLSPIDEDEMPLMPLPFAGSHTVTTSYEYGDWYLVGEGAYGKQSVLKIDGVIGFCLEGWKSEQSGSNAEVSWSTLGMDSYKEKLVLMGYYGYWRNPSAVNYYLTQSLIWDEVMRVQKNMGWQVYATSSYYGYTSLSSMQGFFSDVRSKVDNFYTKPSIHDYWYNCSPGQIIQPEDTRGVLSDCYISDKGGTDARISGNSIIVTAPSTPGEYTIKIKRGTGYLYNDNLFAVRANSSAQAISTLDGNVSWDSSITIRVVESKGKVQITKTSANPSITENNSCYSLAGAEYTVYSDVALTKPVVTLTTDVSGKSNVEEIRAGTYYVKETKAPKGFALDPNSKKITVESGKTATIPFTDLPQSDPINVLLGKVDKETNANKPQGSASLENAEFTVKYYDGFYNVDPASQGQTPIRSWVLKTDSYGYTELSDAYKVSGDAFYKATNGDITLPLGTITIQETKAPQGYHINNEVFVRQITSNGSTEWVDTYNQPTIPEQLLRFYIQKYERGTTNGVAVVEFIHTKPDGTTEILKTDSKGQIEMTAVEQGRHKIVEQSTIPGLVVNTNEFIFDVTSNGTISVVTNDLENRLMAYTEDSKGDGHLTVYNDFADFTIALNKINDDKKTLEGATFNLYDDADCTHQISSLTTNSSGYITFKNLDVDKTYYFREEKAPQGYRLPLDQNGNPVVHTVRIVRVSPVNGVFQFEFDGQLYDTSNTTGTIRLQGTPDNYYITQDVINVIGIKLPVTGSSLMIGLTTFALILIGFGFAFGLTVKKSRKENQTK